MYICAGMPVFFHGGLLGSYLRLVKRLRGLSVLIKNIPNLQQAKPAVSLGALLFIDVLMTGARSLINQSLGPSHSGKWIVPRSLSPRPQVSRPGNIHKSPILAPRRELLSFLYSSRH